MPKISTSSTAAKKPVGGTTAAAAKKTTKAKPKSADTYVPSASDPLGIGSIRESRGVKPITKVVLSDGIQSELPTHALGDISTHGRHAAGFRLDGGSVRNLWVSTRRITEGTKKGYEIFFFAEPEAVKTFKERLETLKAKKATYQFHAGKPDDDGDGKATLVRKGETWSPSTGTALSLEVEGKYKVELNTGAPEALRGAMRVRVYGTDATAGKNLQECIKKLGLQAVFQPSTDEAVQKLKIERFLWQRAHEELAPLTMRAFGELSRDEVEAALVSAEVKLTGDDVKAIKKADLADEKIATRVKLAALYLEKAPNAFIEWASSNYYGQHGILPHPSYEWNKIEDSMESADITKAAIKKATNGPVPDEDEARKVLLFGLLAKGHKDEALSLMQKSPESLSLSELKSFASEHGGTATRLGQLRFEEVYPGYFTVVDPAQVEELSKAGARYLYSTYDDADRVMSMLTGGQKSSLTRFSEGLIVQGKSSSSDFGTGGALAVFTRLVTKSAVEKGEKATGKSSGYSYSYDGKFNDWGGSRPYKVIINKSILARTDWWGYNGDNFGRSTNLKKENFGVELIKEIDKNYSSSNELMFPVGNDPAYADFVVCNSQDQKDKLIEKMKAAGMKEYNGKPLTEFVRVETHFFDY